MGHRQLAGQDGHRWDVDDEGSIDDRDGSDSDAAHQLRFTRDDGTERVRPAPRSLDQMADVELRSLLEDGDADAVERGPDTDANDTGGYGDARD